ncbi:MAG: hypothetical protein IKG03_06120 [Clostridiales bacterium]|nr:hypothetical protein [Clostridiales bacterium]
MIPRFNNFKPEKSASSREILPAGGYVCKILKAEIQTNDWGSQLVLSFDISEGEYKDFFKTDYNSQPEDRKKWRGVWRRINIPTDDGSQEDTWRQNKIKNLAACLQDSNAGYVWDWDETKLKDKALGILFREFEWEMEDRSGVSTEAYSCTDIDSVRAGKFKIAKRRELKHKVTAPAPTSVTDDSDLPF